VRDAAVDLVGKYIVQKPALAAEYYRHIAERIEVSQIYNRIE
jgi:cohesin loading factor subunit SCC2